ncbi:amidase [Microlunatus soli]|uniref:Aspartyl-tRNA(Asn)/glutamyl-tRNA(Gln) amidotransferase subunit A n=1 Tax=Microlunatus soli TaxID=630515 RepID=A0A1H1ZJS8_9ACTN|nr:amidase [Microlunatus soli]SDT33817.1 aspartyl-tRNA(Asn)/glutamyl-tRNA(Gln) amidotransferase subunit A [Microlunatus soli]
MNELSMITATDLVDRYRSNTVSPVEATEAALQAIEQFQDRVNAFVLVDPDGALAVAAESERRWQQGRPLGPLDGVPMSIKDIFLTDGWPTLRGSKLIDKAGPWTEDAPAVARLRAGGAVFLGKTTTPEYAWKGVTDSPAYGATGNPWDAHHHAGGSSGGSATAVGLGMGPVSIGTDGGGSVRIPASFTGTTALKPTYGLIPMYPPSPFGTLSHAGPMTRTVADAAILLDLITGFDHRDWSAMPTPQGSFADGLGDGVEGLRIGFSADLGYGRNAPGVLAAVRDAVTVFAEAGAQVTEVDPGFADPVEAFHVLWFSGAAKVLQGHDEEFDSIDPGLRRIVETGRGFNASDYLDATAVRMAMGVTMGAFHTDYDLLITPTMPITSFGTERQAPEGWPSQLWTSWTPYTYPFNMTQQPALSVPCGFSDGLPVGLQIVGPRHADRLVLRAGQAFQDRTDWHLRLPNLITG